MAGSKKKKVGGIKARPKGTGRAAARVTTATTPRKKKKVGGVSVVVTEAASTKHRYCTAGCQGSWQQGMWCHDDGCSELRMIWKAHGATRSSWQCFYECPGQEMPSGWTHHPDCAFWYFHPSLTPFHTEREVQACFPTSLFS